MSYQVLARKYRPQTFGEVVGQQHVIRTLRNAIETGRIPHAFLFVGPRGIGKTSTARILAKALNAPEGPSIDFDPEHPLCREISEGRCMDVLEIDGASNNGVEQVRDLRDNVQYAPTNGQYKIYVIDEVHMLSTAAFNALLKTLEEPPAHVKFIFATTEVHKLPATILSRCQRFDLKRIAEEDIAQHLGMICQKEKINIEPSALKILARNAEGGLRDAESALEQLISFCGNTITEKDVLEVFGLTGASEVWALAQAITEGDTSSALKQVRELTTKGKDSERLAKEIMHYYRSMLTFLINKEEAAKLDANELEHFKKLESIPSVEIVMAFIEELLRLEEKLRFALVKDVVFEIAMLRMAQQKQKVSLEAVLKELTSGNSANTQHTATPKTRPVEKARPAAPEHTVNYANQKTSPSAVKDEPSHRETASSDEKQIDPKIAYTKATKRLIEKDASFRRYVECCDFTSFEAPYFNLVMTATRALYDSLLKSTKPAELSKALGSALEREIELQIDFVPRKTEEKPEKQENVVAAPNNTTKDTSNTSATEDLQVLSEEDYLNDPLIKQALEIFDARIVEIRKNNS